MRTTPRGLIWTFGIAVVVLDAASLWLLREASVPVLSATLPSMLLLCGVDVFVNREKT